MKKYISYAILLFLSASVVACHKKTTYSHTKTKNTPTKTKTKGLSTVTAGKTEPVKDEFDKYMEDKARQQEGKLASNFTATGLDGKTYTLDALKGKTVLLSFWFAKCVPCIAEIESLKELHKDFSPQGLVILSLALDNDKIVQPIVKDKGVNYITIPSAQTIADSYSVTQYPNNILIDKKGKIRKVFTGGSSFDQTHLYREVKPTLLTMLSE